MSLKTADDVYVKEEPGSDLPIEYEPPSALAAITWQDIKLEWDSETCDESDVAPTPRLYTECDEDERAQSLVDLVKAEEQSESACLSKDEGQYIKEEVKEELELGPTVFLRPRVTLVCQDSSQDNGTNKPDTESVSSGVLGHQKTQYEENPYKCGYSTYTTRYKINYTRYERQHIHDNTSMSEGTLHATEKNQAKKRERIHTGDKPFKCTHCSYSCDRKRYLKIHETLHTGDKPYKCTTCSYSCALKSSLNRHERIHSGDKPYKCSYCSYSSTQKSNLKGHESTHTGNKPYKCNNCSYSCALKNTLNYHERIHAGDKPYKCTYCSYSCAIKGYLKRHEVIHTGEKPHKCAYCTYSCALKWDLRRHESIHTGDKPFKCTQCSYGCVRKSSLKVHEMIHSRYKLLQCAHCEYSSRLKVSLKKHLKLHFPKIEKKLLRKMNKCL